MLSLAEHESSFGEHKRNPKSSATGTFQITVPTFSNLTKRKGSALSQYASLNPERDKEKIRTVLEDPRVNMIAAMELMEANRQAWRTSSGKENMWAVVASHHQGAPKLMDLYQKYGLDYDDHPARLVLAMRKGGKLSDTEREFVEWFPKVQASIESNRRMMNQ